MDDHGVQSHLFLVVICTLYLLSIVACVILCVVHLYRYVRYRCLVFHCAHSSQVEDNMAVPSLRASSTIQFVFFYNSICKVDTNHEAVVIRNARRGGNIDPISLTILPLSFDSPICVVLWSMDCWARKPSWHCISLIHSIRANCIISSVKVATTSSEHLAVVLRKERVQLCQHLGDKFPVVGNIDNNKFHQCKYDQMTHGCSSDEHVSLHLVHVVMSIAQNNFAIFIRCIARQNLYYINHHTL